MIRTILELIPQNSDKIFAIIVLIFISILVRILLQVLGQKWIMTTAHTCTLVLLPILTYIITSVISGNIALSLGMVGALSIVRFRNPVRSPLELSVYFGSITMGIAASVSIIWLLFFVGAISLAVLSLIFVNYFNLKILGKNFFTTSFSEGNSLSTLEIKSLISLKQLDESNLLTFKNSTKNDVHYVLCSNSYEELLKIQSLFENDNNIISSQLNK